METTDEMEKARERQAPAFGRNLTAWRRRRGWQTQARFAAACGMTASQLCRIELGDVAPRLDVIARLAAALEVSPGRLIAAPPRENKPRATRPATRPDRPEKE